MGRLELGLVFFLLAVVSFGIGRDLWRRAKRTPKGELVSWGYIGGAWVSRDAALANAAAAIFLGVALVFIGIWLAWTGT